MRKKTLYAVAGVVVVAAGIQLVPVERTNPPADPTGSFEAVAAPAPEVAALVGKACKDCHSNETVWPGYSRIAPASWLVARDVQQGRARLNLSEWRLLSPEMSRLRIQAMCEEARDGEMPPLQYRLIHSDARLSEAEVSTLCAAVAAERR